MITKYYRTKILPVIFVTILLLIGIAGCVVPEGSQVGDKAPDFTLSTLDGGQVTLSGLKGKPVMLVFWTTGCSACIAQMPFLKAAHDELGNNVEFININLGESSSQVQATVSYYGFSLPVALDSDYSVSESYNIIYTPTNILIDKNGVITYIRKGSFLNADELLERLGDLE